MDTAVKNFIPSFREFHELMLGNPFVTDTDLIGMGFPERPAGGRTPAPVATDPPSYDVRPELGHILRIDFYDIDRKKTRGKPDGQHGAEINWAYKDATPVDNPEHFPNSMFDTATPFTLTFQSEDSGREIYISLRWENTRGLKGPWSVVETIHVP
jgi:hypothetical protein